MNLQVPGAGVIFHTASVSALAAQLSWGCTPVTPDKKTVISRFYTRDVLQALARCADVDWHAFLFKSINAWWTPDEDAWKPIVILSSTYENPLNHAVRIDSETWAQIADRPEIESMLNQWQARPSAREFPPCVQRSMVIKALNKARGVGLSIPEEQKLYALVWLDGKKALLASEIFQKALPVVIRGERRLSEVLLEAERSDINKGKSDGIF